MTKNNIIQKYINITSVLLALLFSFFLFFNTFKVDSAGNIEIASKLWSDFASTFPLVRSFSMGNNFPPQYPIFAGPAIRYHFIFYAIVGLIEKAGLRIDLSLNILSSLSFFALIIIIFKLSLLIFKNRAVGYLSVIMFLFNGSLSFLEYFKNYSNLLEGVTNIIKNTVFPSFGPYDGKIVSAFWNLNIYTNQRHLAFAYFSFLLLVFFIYRNFLSGKDLSLKQIFCLGIFVGIFPFFHLAIFFVMGITLIIFLFIFPKLRRGLFFAGIFAALLALPQIIFMGFSQVKINIFNPGYLIENLSFFSFIKYWFFNLGINFFLIPTGFVLANKNQRKIFLPFLFLFIISNCLQFSPEIAANHKFVNLFAIGGNFLSAFVIVSLFRKSTIGKLLSIPIFFLLILSGVIDFFPVINDKRITLFDVPNNSAAKFIQNNTDKNAVFLNSSFLYHPASIAGRKIFLGWPYFSWSAGYDTDERYKTLIKIYSGTDKQVFCNFLKEYSIDYFTVENTAGDRDFPELDLDFFKNNFNYIYSDTVRPFYIASREGNC